MDPHLGKTFLSPEIGPIYICSSLFNTSRNSLNISFLGITSESVSQWKNRTSIQGEILYRGSYNDPVSYPVFNAMYPSPFLTRKGGGGISGCSCVVAVVERVGSMLKHCFVQNCPSRQETIFCSREYMLQYVTYVHVRLNELRAQILRLLRIGERTLQLKMKRN